MQSITLGKINQLGSSFIRSSSLFLSKSSSNSSLTTLFKVIQLNLLDRKFTMVPTTNQKVGEFYGNVFVQNNRDKNMMTISFIYENDSKTKQFNLYRQASEPLSLSLERIRLNLSKVSKRDKKQKLDNSEQQTNGDSVKLTLDGSTMNPDTTRNIEAWVEGAVLGLNGKSYVIRTNCPSVETLTLPSCIMKGFIITPHIVLTNCDMRDCQFGWFRKITAQERVTMLKEKGVNEEQIHCTDNCYWYKVSDHFIYQPNDQDVGHLLKITCSPSDSQRKGLEYSTVSKSPVELGPSECPFEKRHAFTSERLLPKKEFRVVTYNILADLYADSEYSRSVLFAHCPSYALDIDYRRQLLLKEISGYNSDIICLQEVDRKEFVRTYEHFFKLVAQCSGIFNTKGGQVGEGLATFYRDEKFELVDSHITLLSDLIEPKKEKSLETGTSETKVDDEVAETELKSHEIFNSKPHPILACRESEHAKECLSNFDEIRAAIFANEELKKRFLDRHSVLQTTLMKFKDVENSYIIVFNTHLYFAPDADHVRLLQGSVCVKYMEFIQSYYKKSFNLNQTQSKVNVVFCGDMNSTPDCGLYKLLLSGDVGSDLPDWSSNKDEKVLGLNVHTDLRFRSAYQDIAYTNYTPGFSGCLDYIYYRGDNLSCESTIPLPSHEEVISTGGIPSEVFPSDHLALIANFKLTD